MKTITSEKRKVRPVKSLANALRILEILATYQDGIGVSELARQTKQSKTAVYNVLRTFELYGYVKYIPQTEQYRLGWRVYEIASIFASNFDLFQIIRPAMARLVQQSGETVLIGTLDGGEAVYIDQYESPNPLRFSTNRGGRIPLHSTATGKALLAFQPADYIDKIIEQGLERFTDYTIIDGDKLREELGKIRAQGFAECLLEHVLDHCSVAAPVRNRHGQVEYALVLVGPTSRFKDKIGEMTPLLLEEAQALERELGMTSGAAKQNGR